MKMMPTMQLYELPLEVLSVIFQKLRIQDVLNLIQTCKPLRNLILNDNAIWRSITRSRLIIQNYEDTNTFKLSWTHRCRISHNWCKAKFKNRAILFQDRNYMPWLKYHNSEALLLTVGSDLNCYPVTKDGFPKGRHCMWKLSMPNIKRYDKRTDDISRFVLKENLLVCGNRNGSVAVYKVDNIESHPQSVQYIEDCHIDGEVSAVEIINNKDNAYLVTGSMHSPLLLFWNWGLHNSYTDLGENNDVARISFNMELGELRKVTTKSLALNTAGDKLAIGPDGNSKPILADISRVEFLIKSAETLDSSQSVMDVRWRDDNTLCYVTHAGRLQMMDIRTHHVVYSTRDPFEASFYCVKTDGSHAAVAGTAQHSRCVLYDDREPHHVQLYFTQEKWKTSPVYSLDFDSTKLIAAAARGVTALDFNVPHTTESRDYSEVKFN